MTEDQRKDNGDPENPIHHCVLRSVAGRGVQQCFPIERVDGRVASTMRYRLEQHESRYQP